MRCNAFARYSLASTYFGRTALREPSLQQAVPHYFARALVILQVLGKVLGIGYDATFGRRGVDLGGTEDRN